MQKEYQLVQAAGQRAICEGLKKSERRKSGGAVAYNEIEGKGKQARNMAATAAEQLLKV